MGSTAVPLGTMKLPRSDRAGREVTPATEGISGTEERRHIGRTVEDRNGDSTKSCCEYAHNHDDLPSRGKEPGCYYDEQARMTVKLWSARNAIPTSQARAVVETCLIPLERAAGHPVITSGSSRT